MKAVLKQIPENLLLTIIAGLLAFQTAFMGFYASAVFENTVAIAKSNVTLEGHITNEQMRVENIINKTLKKDG